MAVAHFKVAARHRTQGAVFSIPAPARLVLEGCLSERDAEYLLRPLASALELQQHVPPEGAVAE
eukprot:5544446-Alexandrium_andersonii.AAC.1